MAEIRIQEKRNNWWPWLLGALALLLLGWVVFEAVEESDEYDEMTAEVVDNDYNYDDYNSDAKAIAATDNSERIRPQAVNANGINLDNFDVEWDGAEAGYDVNVMYYLSSLDYLDAQMNLNHDYSNLTLRALANSIIALAKEQNMADEVDVMEEAAYLRKMAEQVTQDWRSGEHADMIRKAAMSASETIHTIQKANFPELSETAAQLKQEAKEIDPAVLTLDQKENIRSFFRTAADALSAMRDV